MRNAIIAVGLVLGLLGCFSSDEVEVNFPAYAGKRVVYIADSDGDDASTFGDEAFVADTGSLTQTVTRTGNISAPAYFEQPGAVGTSGPLAVRLVSDPLDGCPSNVRLLPRTGGIVETIFSGECVYTYASNPSGTRLVFMATIGLTGTNLYVMDPADPDTIEQINVGNTNFPGTVEDFEISADGASLFWADATGVAYANLTVTLDQIRFSASLIGPTDHPTGLYPLPNGTGVIYARDDVERYQVVLTNGSEVYITNPLGAGDLLDRSADGVRVSSNSATLLYAVTIGGVKQLWGLPIAVTFSEARIDSAIAQLLQAGHSFEFSPDGLSYAWLGDDGTGNTVFTAAVNSPANIITLTPVTEEPTGALRWSDGSTLVYVSTDADLALPVGASALRTVNTGSPLLSITMGPNESQGYSIGDIDVCSDGTLAFAMSLSGASITSAMYSANPQSANSAFQISPTITSTTAEIFKVNCVD